nr:uncharacterized protein LOC121502101 [Drosophila kikkawai]
MEDFGQPYRRRFQSSDSRDFLWVYSDNAKNFVGASNVLQELNAAFHHRLWEAAVKSAKHRLLRGVGHAKLTADEWSTHLVEVEALLNSRPIASPGNDLNDGEVLTPGHLLIGQALLSLPHESGTGVIFSKAGCEYLRRWRMLSALKQLFWDSWSKDYLVSL